MGKGEDLTTLKRPFPRTQTLASKRAYNDALHAANYTA
jgi:hypothetical protein